MRWRCTYPGPKSGDERYLHTFLWFPKCIKGDCRWGERAIIRQRFWECWDICGWSDEEWINP